MAVGGRQSCGRVSLATKGIAWVSLWTHHMCWEDQQQRRGMTERSAFLIREEMRHLNRKEREYIDQDPWEIREKFTDLSKRNLCTFFILSDVSCPLIGVHKSFKVFLPSERPTIFLSKFLLFWNFYFFQWVFLLAPPGIFYAYFQFSWILQNTVNGSSSYVNFTTKLYSKGICVFEKSVSFGKLWGCELPSTPMRKSKSSCFIN